MTQQEAEREITVKRAEYQNKVNELERLRTLYELEKDDHYQQIRNLVNRQRGLNENIRELKAEFLKAKSEILVQIEDKPENLNEE